MPKRVRKPASHQRLPGAGAQPKPGALTTDRGAERLRPATNPALAGLRDSCWVLPPASCWVAGAALLPVPRMVVRSEAVASPTLAMVTGVVWPPSSGQTQRAEYGSRVTGAAGWVAEGRALAPSTSTAATTTRVPARPKLVPRRSDTCGARS